MAPTLFWGDRVVVNRTSYGLKIPFTEIQLFESEPQKDDVIFFNSPLKPTKSLLSDTFIGVITALPADTIEVNKNYQFIRYTDKKPLYKRVYKVAIENEAELNQKLIEYNIKSHKINQDNTSCYYPLNSYEVYLLDESSYGLVQALKPDIQSTPTPAAYKLIIPKKGENIEITPWNLSLIYNAILLHEGVDSIEVINHHLYLDGEKITSYKFKQDYYWITVYDNSTMVDSSTYGFVPRRSIIGSPIFIWLSKQPETTILSGYNWARSFTSLN